MDSLRHRPSTCCSPSPPKYQAEDGDECAKLGSLVPSSVTTSTPSLPKYESVVGPEAFSSASSPYTTRPTNTHPSRATGLQATHAFQIDTRGHPLLALPVPPRPDPIPVYGVLPTGEVGALVYESLRETRRSGSCLLVRPGGDGSLDRQPVCSTTYRVGPGRPPKVRLVGDVGHDEEFELRGSGCHTRAQNMRTHLGSFQWRYAGRAERKAAGASDLLVLDLIAAVAGERAERRRAVAHLVRNDELRTQRTGATTAGNGGRLLVDLGGWLDAKGEAQQMEVLVVASCIAMLKKEVDRRRALQIMVMAGGASGGP